ncbi:MAG: peptide ABC transporter permease [Sphingorhabdus sp.]|nr:peptide ABC transporter permease [Sphingorhabdus sp.]
MEGQKARGGEIILNKPWRRIVFFGGLIAMVLFIIVATIMGYS